MRVTRKLGPDARAAGNDAAIGPGKIRACVERVLTSETFARSDRLRRFIRFTVDETMAGRTDRIKEMTIALEVYGRRPAIYNPKADPIVRTEARRLRAKLARYYEEEGRDDPVVMSYPRGRYVPAFSRRQDVEEAGEVTGREAGGARAAKSTGEDVGVTPARIAVLPFEDLSGAGDITPLGQAMGESIITSLVRLGCPAVVSRSSAALLAGSGMPIREMAFRLHADYLVIGSVQKVGGRCRVTVRLVEPAADVHLWCEEYEFNWSNLFSVQSDIARHVAQNVTATARAISGARETTPSPMEAYEAAAQGRFFLRQFGVTRQRKHFEAARSHFERALELKPDFVHGLSGYAHLLVQNLYPPQRDRAELLRRTGELLHRALAADPDHARSLALLGEVYEQTGNRNGALQVASRAVEIDPSDAIGRGLLAYRYRGRGFHEAALEQFEQAIRHDPLWMFAQFAKVETLLLLGRIAEARQTLTAMNEIHPGTPLVSTPLSSILMAEGKPAEALEVLSKARSIVHGDVDVSFLEISGGLASAMTGDRREAWRVLRKYGDSTPRLSPHLTMLCLAAGDLEQAVRRIRTSPNFGNYRWFVEQPLARPHLDRPELRKLLHELWVRWQADLEAAALGLEPRPPALPPPEEVFADITVLRH